MFNPVEILQEARMSLSDRVGVDKYANMIVRNAIQHLNGNEKSVYPVKDGDGCGSVEFLYRQAAYYRKNGLPLGKVLSLFIEPLPPYRPKKKVTRG